MVESRANNSIQSMSASRSSGFTLVEILMVLAIITVLTAIAYPVYTSYINKAKITLGISTLENVRKTLEVYHLDNGNYPPDIDPATGKDSLGNIVLPTALLDEFKYNLFSMESYITAIDSYTLTVKAKDSKHTQLVLTPRQVITQGP